MITNKLENVYYINLKDREDRKKHVENELNKLGWKYNRFEAIKTKNGRIGCSMSHLKLLILAKEKKLPYIVIVEDDIVFKNMEMFNNLFDNFLDKKIDFDVFLIAGNIRNPPFNFITDNIIKVNKSYTTTGYIVNSHYYDKLITNIKSGLELLIKNVHIPYYTIDTYWFSLQEKDKWYICYPRTVSQLANDYSNIENKYINYDHVMIDKI